MKLNMNKVVVALGGNALGNNPSEQLELVKLDTHDGNVRIKGKIVSYQYLDKGESKKKEESFMAKLFK